MLSASAVGAFSVGVALVSGRGMADYNAVCADTRPLEALTTSRGKSEHVRTRWWATPTRPMDPGEGQCHREQTADELRKEDSGKGETVR